MTQFNGTVEHIKCSRVFVVGFLIGYFIAIDAAAGAFNNGWDDVR